MAKYTKQEALTFIESIRMTLAGKVGFRWMVEKLADLEDFIAAEPKLATTLMFAGQAEEAMSFYTSLFDDSRIDFVQKYGPDYPGPEGQVVHARFTLAGQPFVAMDSAVEQHFAFTPAISIFVTCHDEDEIDRLHAAFTEGGSVMMELGEYPFAAKYAWVQDRFGVSWQLILPK
jgi:predicted 3-demethylubiquinone-9 3-methyltransferase (glyoxalase superfamily)